MPIWTCDRGVSLISISDHINPLESAAMTVTSEPQADINSAPKPYRIEEASLMLQRTGQKFLPNRLEIQQLLGRVRWLEPRWLGAVGVGGAERTASEYKASIDRGGFREDDFIKALQWHTQ